jgi:starch phosphorylase
LNGIDTDSFDPARDPNLARNFTRDTLDARAANKSALQKQFALPLQAEIPLLAIVGRLNWQKGMDLIGETIEHILDTCPAQLVVMGMGEQSYHDFFAQLKRRYPGRVGVSLTYEPTSARQIYAGADILLMPSRSEPSGTDQMLAMRYGCIPVVRATGGLADSVVDFNARATRGTGFVFTAPDRWSLFAAIARALQVYAIPEAWRELQIRAMTRDSSWNAAAQKYVTLYHDAIENKARATQAARELANDIHETSEKLAALPTRIARLRELAYNIWWGWNSAGRRAFQDLDPELWERVQRNSVNFLREIDPAKMHAASQDQDYLKKYDTALAQFDTYQQAKSTWFKTAFPSLADRTIAYLSFEFGVHASLPIYSGGLGVLSGDHIKEASDLGLPFVGIGFLYPQGYFTQRLNPDGWQEAIHEKLNFALVPAEPAKDKNGGEIIVEVELPGRSVYAKLWRIQVGRVPIFLMDTDIASNAPNDRTLAAQLYGGDREMRLIQEYILGVGSVRALRALGYQPGVWHLNEGHCAFSVLERARELVCRGMTFEQACEAVRATTVFTTHTPVPAGNDTFAFELIAKYFAAMWRQLGITRDQFFAFARQPLPWGATEFSMTVLALKFAGAANGVSELHGQVSRRMWQFLWPERAENDVPIGHITNGVHSRTWLAPEYQNLFDKYFPGDWRDHIDDPALWESIEKVPDEMLWATHCALKQRLVELVRASTRVEMNPDALTLGFARRFATYKRATLAFREVARLERMMNAPGRPLQILFSGKAHPDDNPGKEFIRQIVQFARQPGFAGHIAFVEDYNILVARMLVQGADVWLNNPRRPLEASGTSGQKAALNGLPNFSVLDGWWREGFVSGVNGWAIGEDRSWDNQDAQDAADAESFYATLENEIVPLYYTRAADGVPYAWVRRMKDTIKTIAPRFSTMRMVKEYVTRCYVPAATR